MRMLVVLYFALMYLSLHRQILLLWTYNLIVFVMISKQAWPCDQLISRVHAALVPLPTTPVRLSPIYSPSDHLLYIQTETGGARGAALCWRRRKWRLCRCLNDNLNVDSACALAGHGYGDGLAWRHTMYNHQGWFYGCLRLSRLYGAHKPLRDK